MSAPELHRFGGDPAEAALAWRLPAPQLVASTASVGGGIGTRRWVVNVQVPPGYARRDVEAHVHEVATALDLSGAGVGMLTAASVPSVTSGDDSGVRVYATVGLALPVWAAAAAERVPSAAAGTINVVAFVPERHAEAALANLLCTATEAKVQALADRGVPGTGTASDAVTVLCPLAGRVEPFGGPRSIHGGPLARAVYAAVRAGIAEA